MADAEAKRSTKEAGQHMLRAQVLCTNARPLRLVSLKSSSHWIGAKTAFSGFGETPTGELKDHS